MAGYLSCNRSFLSTTIFYSLPVERHIIVFFVCYSKPRKAVFGAEQFLLHRY
jgi:hypothetical protein